MIKYLVKETCIATNDNPNFAGETLVYWIGKESLILKREGGSRECDNFDRMKYMLKKYGYNRECDAKKNSIYRSPEKSKYWNSTAEIVGVEF